MLDTTPGGRRYGARNFLPQAHEPKAKFVRSSPLPPIVELGGWDGPIKDQGSEGSCTAQSGASLVEWIWRRYYKKSPVLSPAFLYALELQADGSFPRDEGSSPLTTCQILNEVGVCEEALMPYRPSFITDPTPEQRVAAAHYRLGGYHLLNGLPDFLSALADPTPWPPVVAFDVYESFEAEGVARTGMMSVPKSGEQLLGGHQVKASGYHLPNRMALMQNSWGTGWGINGYFWMPFEVLERSAMRIIHPGHW